jgi:hypothetical protein
VSNVALDSINPLLSEHWRLSPGVKWPEHENYWAI